ncbi:hypothetical protein PG605_12040, partial [Riemerella anatipestifer]|nr:hypothetical protein [Riemerella anatipestifer]MDY3350345.1 hypothetical protein [Riemerella anatipestifer]
MKKIILIILLGIVHCFNAQRTISLAQAYEYSKSPNGIPEDVSYAKDINGDLNRFVGTWKGIYNGKTYEFNFVKKLNDDKYEVRWDFLIGRLKITDRNGKIIYNTFNEDDDKTYFSGWTFQRRTYMMDFIANTECNDSGVVFMEVYSKQPNKMRLYMDRDKIWYNPERCPNYETY